MLNDSTEAYLECAGRAERRRRFGLDLHDFAFMTIQRAVDAELCRHTPKETDLPRFALQSKAGPVVGRAPSFVFGKRELGGTQGSGRTEFFRPQHFFVETAHQFSRRRVVDVPQADQHPCRARVHEAAR